MWRNLLARLLRAYSAKYILAITWAYMSRLPPRIATQAILIRAPSAPFCYTSLSHFGMKYMLLMKANRAAFLELGRWQFNHGKF